MSTIPEQQTVMVVKYDVTHVELGSSRVSFLASHSTACRDLNVTPSHIHESGASGTTIAQKQRD